jgi:hypothetical protein
LPSLRELLKKSLNALAHASRRREICADYRGDHKIRTATITINLRKIKTVIMDLYGFCTDLSKRGELYAVYWKNVLEHRNLVEPRVSIV